MPSREMGTSAPVKMMDMDLEGRWFVYCQARQDTNGDGKISFHYEIEGQIDGDDLSEYLVVGAGAEEPIDQEIDRSPSGRWIVIKKDNAVFLLDVVNGTRTPLRATLRHTYLRGVRGPALDDRVLLYEDGDRLFVRILETGEERELHPPAGLIWKAWLEGDTIVVGTIPADTDGDGYVDGDAELGGRVADGYTCSGWGEGGLGGLDADLQGADALFTIPQDSDRVMTSIASEMAGDLRDAPGFVHAYGSDRLFRRDDASLVIERDGRAQKLLASSRCQGQVEAVGQGPSYVVICRDGSVELDTPGARYPTPIRGKLPGVDAFPARPPYPRLLEIYDSERGNTYLDTKTKRVLTFGTGIDVTAGPAGTYVASWTYGPAHHAVWHDVDSGDEKLLPVDLKPIDLWLWPHNASSGYVQPSILVDWATGEVVRRFDGLARVVTDAGILEVSRQPVIDLSPEWGPLRWRSF
jgi:hypothetical protein